MYDNLIRKSILIAVASITIMGCDNSDDSGYFRGDRPPSVAKSELQYLGSTVPFSIQQMADEPPIYKLGLMPHARVFSLNENVLNNALYDEMPDGRKVHDQYGTNFIKLLKESEQNDVPVRVYVLPETNEIWWVVEATDEDIESYEASKQPEK